MSGWLRFVKEPIGAQKSDHFGSVGFYKLAHAKPHLPVSIIAAAVENWITPLHHQLMFNLASQIHGLKNVDRNFLEYLNSNVFTHFIEKKPQVKLICQTLDPSCPRLKFADILFNRASLFRRCQKFVWVGRHLPGVAAK